MSENEKGNNEALIDFVKSTHGAQVLTETIDADTVAIVPRGFVVERVAPWLERSRDRPRRASGSTELFDELSFIDWTRRNQGPSTCVYVSDRACVSVINDHDAGESGGLPGWGDFRGSYTLKASEELGAWSRAGAMDQKAFARFLEDRILDVLTRSLVGEQATEVAEALGVPLAGPTELMALSRGLTLRVNQKVTGAVNLSSGESEFAFAEAHTDAKGAPLKVPGAFAIAIPMHDRGPAYKLPVRLRYNLSDGAVIWRVEPLRVSESLAAATQEIADRIAGETGLPVFRGIPSDRRAD